MIAIPLFMILALVGLGSLAALVFGIVYAIVNKRPGVAVASVLAPVAVLFAGALLVTLFARSSTMVQSDSPVHMSWKGGPSMPAMPPMPAMPAMPAAPHISVDQIRVQPDFANWILLAIALVVVFGAVKLFRKRASCNGERRCGWGKALAVTLLIVLAAKFLFVRASHNSMQAARGRAEATRELAEQSRQIRENAKLQEFETERRVEEDQVRQQEELQRAVEALERAAVQAVEGKSMQELWEKLNEPRIKLENDDHGASLTMGAGANKIAIVTPEAGGAKLIVPISEKTPESLARSLARLERMVEQVSAVADKVSDAGTLVGKAMIALNDTMDSPRTAATPAVESHAEVAAEMSPPPVDVEDGETFSSLKLVSEHPPIEDPLFEGTAAVGPEWIEIPPGRIGNVWREVVVTEEYATPDECARAADVYLLLKTYEHFAQLLDNPRSENTLPTLSFNTKERGAIAADGKVIYEQRGNTGVWLDERIRTLANMGIGIDFIRREVVPDNREYYETTQRSVGEMKKLYTMLEFTPSVDAELLRRWDELRRQDRFAAVGAGAGSVLGLIGLAFGLLKVDTWTRGYYTKRLFFGVPAAIIGLVGLLSLAAGK